MHRAGRGNGTLSLMQSWVHPDMCFQNFQDAGDLTHQFHLTFKQAAWARGISRRAMRNLCNERRIARWPSRAINSMRGKRKCSVTTAPVVPEHEPTSNGIVPMGEKKSCDAGARSDSCLMQTVDDSTSWIDISADWDQVIAADFDQVIAEFFADSAPGARLSSPDPPPPSPPYGFAFSADLDEFFAELCADLASWSSPDPPPLNPTANPTLPAADPSLPTADLVCTLGITP